MKSLIAYFLLLPLLLACHGPEKNVVPAKTLEIKGCDLSFLPEFRQSGMACQNLSGVREDMLATLKNAGATAVRLRLWNHPANGHSGFEEVKLLSQEIKNSGMKVWLTVHYSDTWADPGAQQKPALWQGISFPQLKDSVYLFTQKIMTEINPDFIQIGNEINNGLLWPDGRYDNRSQMIELLKQGISAVRTQSAHTKIIIHYAGHENAAFFYEIINELDYDIIGLSYYPVWHGKDLGVLQTALSSLGSQFKKDVLIAETSYPFTFGWNDWTNNVVGAQEQILPSFPATAQGQYDYLNALKSLMLQTPRGIGFCYWGAEWVSWKGNTAQNGSSWENQALWDFSNKALPAIRVFGQ